MIDGKRYELEEYKYSNQEIAAAQRASKLPYVRFKLKDVDNSKILKTGTLTPLYFSTSTAANVLVVGNDSLYEEGDKYFVYVKTDSSDKEKREIKIGAQDDNYTEVKSGLSEGDLVYYDSDSTIPSDYTTYEIKLGTFKTTGTSKSYKMVDTNQITYKAPVEGYFTQLDLAEGQEVKKGDLLYIVDSGGGSAELLELNSQISDAKSDYDSTVAGYEEQIKDLRAEIEDYRSGRKKQQVATPGDADQTGYVKIEAKLPESDKKGEDVTGIVYEVYKDASCKDEVGAFVLSCDGKAYNSFIVRYRRKVDNFCCKGGDY